MVLHFIGGRLNAQVLAAAVDLLEIKNRMGLPDARMDKKECQLYDQPEFPGGIPTLPEGLPQLLRRQERDLPAEGARSRSSNPGH